MNFGFDLDGVLCDSQVVFQTLMFREFGTYNFKSKDKMGNELFKYEVDGASSEYIWTVIREALMWYQPFMQPVEGAVGMVHSMLRHTEKPVTIITARPTIGGIEQATHEWVIQKLRLQAPDYRLFLVPPPDNGTKDNMKSKNKLVEELELEYFVEDRLKYAADIAEVPCIKKVYLMNRPWNLGRQEPEKVIRVSNFHVLRYRLFRDEGKLFL